MTFLIGIALAGLTEIIKVMTAKLGKQLTKAIIYIILLLGALGYGYLKTTGFFEGATWAAMATTFLTAIGAYEFLIKTFVQPTLGYSSKMEAKK